MIWKYFDQNVLFPKDLNWVQHWGSRVGRCLKFGLSTELINQIFVYHSPTDAAPVSLETYLLYGLYLSFHYYYYYYYYYYYNYWRSGQRREFYSRGLLVKRILFFFYWKQQERRKPNQKRRERPSRHLQQKLNICQPLQRCWIADIMF